MKNLSLKEKIYLVGLIPFCFYFVVVLLSIYDSYSSYQETKILESKIAVVEAASAVIHESQIERGKSAIFLSGGDTLGNLKEQRKMNDTKHLILKEKIKISSFSKEYREELLVELSKYESLRAGVDSGKMGISNTLKGYTSIIKKFLKLELDLAKSTSFPKVASSLRGYRILEDAKESGGKLRANMSSILAKNTKISNEKFLQITSLKAGVDTNLKSSGLVLNKDALKIISEFSSSNEWTIVNETFQLILSKSKVGSYNQDSVKFFSDITVSLKLISELVTYQKNQLLKEVLDIKQKSLSSLLTGFFVSAALAVSLFVFIFFMTKSITRKMRNIIDRLIENTDKVLKSTKSIETTSSELKNTSSEQTSALQQSVSAIHEISSMIGKNFESSEKSVTVSNNSRKRADIGKKNINTVTSAIDMISETNDEIFKEMQYNNNEVNKITSTILEIEEKTKIINDIVFQTKLLSFNASVEAARAGEHGKGFAVVAEEIASLAKVSGSAAEEISALLDKSVKFVNETISQSKSSIEGLVATGQEKVTSGKSVVKECSNTLDEILTDVESVSSMVSQISIATSEQDIGIKEVKKAMEHLDELAVINDNSAKVSSEMATDLQSSSNSLNESVRSLLALVDGDKAIKF